MYVTELIINDGVKVKKVHILLEKQKQVNIP